MSNSTQMDRVLDGMLNFNAETKETLDSIKKTIDKVFDEVKPTSSKDMGLIMKNISPLVKGRADMSLVNKLIKERLG